MSIANAMDRMYAAGFLLEIGRHKYRCGSRREGLPLICKALIQHDRASDEAESQIKRGVS